MIEERMNLRGQVAIFVIIAILIVGGVIAYFLIRDNVGTNLSKNLEPAYDYYLSCVEATTREGIALLGEQGGYIETPEFVPGSQYRPYSSQLDFFGQPVVYWMYVSGNNILKEQVPSERMMEEQLEDYIAERVSDCRFGEFEAMGYDVFVNKDDAEVSVEISDLSVSVDVDNEVLIYFEEDSAVVNSHSLDVDSKLGKFYGLALEVYNYEKSSMFLEKYGLDVMRLYAPVDGAEISCAPKIFVDEEIEQDLVNGLTANIGMLKLKGDYYTLANQENDYFVTDIGRNIDEQVNFMYSPSWGTRIEIHGDRVVRPVGLQEGLGILGFCYVPYHLVYDIDFPVLVQFWDEQEIFQFPVSVVIDKSQAREALPTLEGINIESEVCKYPNQNVEIRTYDSELNPVPARINFKCLNSQCDVGETEIGSGEAILNAQVPQCVNGIIVARAEGYADEEYQISTNDEDFADIVMRKKYKIDLDLGDVDSALVMFDSESYSATAVYPGMKEVELIDGFYNVSVYVYSNSSLTIPETSRRECVDVPSQGVGGLFGLEEEKCFNIDIPGTKVELAVVGGGKTSEYITEGQLADSVELNINVPLFGKPSTIEGLQENYIKAEEELIYLDFE
jgi:hypothetical protein